VHWLDAFDRLHGAEASSQLREALPHDVSDAIGAGLHNDDWYPLAWFAAMLRAARDQLGGGIDTIETIARASAKAEFSGIHRVLLLFVTPQLLLKISKRVFDRYYTHGSVRSTPIGKREAEVTWTGCRDFDENLWHDCFTAAAVAVEQCGAHEIEWELVEGGGESETATVHYRWR